MPMLSPRNPTLTLVLLVVAACGDAGGGGEGASTTGITVPTQVADATTGTSSGDGEASTVGTAPTTGTATDSESSSTGPACACDPGATQGCAAGKLLTCSDDCLGFAPVACPEGQACSGTECVKTACEPGNIVCKDGATEVTCNVDGTFDAPVACGMTQECIFGDGCTEVCDLILGDPSSVGCVFRANKMQNFAEEPTAVTVGNVSKTLTASVSLYARVDDVETLVGGPLEVAPGDSGRFDLLVPAQTGAVSVVRPGVAYKVVSDVPVVAYQHSPITAESTNDSSMLLPDHAQQKNYVIAAFTPSLVGSPAYFNVVGLKDGTTVQWVSPVATEAGDGVPAVDAMAVGEVVIGDYDLLQVTAGMADLSGTIVTLSEPGWVVGAVECVNIPAGKNYCDHVEEQMIPIEYWGVEYVGAHAPTRKTESYWWRVYASEDATTIETSPPEPGFPVVLDRGQFHEFKTKSSFIFTGDRPFMPVQYLESQNAGAGTGDPASYQMVPVEQFLDRYVFVTGIGYAPNYVQVVRSAGGPDVRVDGAVVGGYYGVGAYEVADWKIDEGSHLAESDAPFGISLVGYTSATSYAYPGGLRLKVINPQ